MLETKGRDYLQAAASMQMKKRHQHHRQGWMGKLPLRITTTALDLIHKQGLKARAALPSTKNPNPDPLEPCSNTFTQQYGLPCSHRIIDLIKRKKTLKMGDIYRRWWLSKPLDEDNPILRVRDPEYVVNLRGRPRIANNTKDRVPGPLRARPNDPISSDDEGNDADKDTSFAGFSDEDEVVETPADLPTTTHLSSSEPPPATRRSSRPHKPSQRRLASLHKEEEAQAEAAQRAAKRGRGGSGRGGRGRGGRTRPSSQP